MPLSVASASAVVLIAAVASAAAAVLVAGAVVTCENENEDDEKNPVAVASVTKEHSVDPLSHLPLHNTREVGKCAQIPVFDAQIS